MKKIILGLAALSALGAAPAPPAGRPAITGISHLAVYSADMAASDHFYGFILGGRKATDPEDASGVRYYFSPRQFVEVLPLPPGQGLEPAGPRRLQYGRRGAAAHLALRSRRRIASRRSTARRTAACGSTQAIPRAMASSSSSPPRAATRPSRARSAGGSSISAISSTIAPPRTVSTATCSASALIGSAPCRKARSTGSRSRCRTAMTGSNI